MQYILALVAICIFLPVGLNAQVEIPTTPRHRDYDAWITQVVTAPHDLIVPRRDSITSRRFRLVVLTSEIYSTAILEELHFGPEGCCARVVSARQISLDSLASRFGMRGELAGFEIVHSLSPTAFRVRFKGRVFDISDVDRPRVRAAEAQP